jgi:hypothetical protein
MRNTVDSGTLSFLVYGKGGSYTGICYELGIVQSGWSSLEEARRHLVDGASAVVGSVLKGDLDASVLNKRPPLGAAVAFYAVPAYLRFRKGMELAIFSKPLQPLGLRNA